MKCPALPAAAALAATLAACGGPADPVEELLAALRAAVEERDADALRDRLATDFRGAGGMDRDAAWQTAQRLLTAYESASVSLYDVVREPLEGGARLRFAAEFSGRPRSLGGLGGLLPPDAVYAFELELREDPEGWRVAAADWQRRDAPGGARDEGVSSSSGGGSR